MAQSVNGETACGWASTSTATQLAADGPLALQPGGRAHLADLAHHRRCAVAGRRCHIARLINRPLKQLSYAANRVKDGDFAASHLDEEVVTSEIREVNIGFNRMAQKLAKLEQDRAVMLAGISHDLRTPWRACGSRPK